MVLLASLLLCCIITCVLTSNAPPQAYRKYRHWSSDTSSGSPVTLILLKATVVTPLISIAEVDVMSCEESTVGPSKFGPPVYLKGIGIVYVHIN